MIASLWDGLPPLGKLIVAGLACALALSAGWWSILAGAIAAGWAGNRGWGPDGAVFAGVAIGVVVYILRCLRDPRTPCAWCKGKSRFFNSEGHFHNCWLCGGSGQRRRLGAKVLARHRSSGD